MHITLLTCLKPPPMTARYRGTIFWVIRSWEEVGVPISRGQHWGWVSVLTEDWTHSVDHMCRRKKEPPNNTNKDIDTIRKTPRVTIPPITVSSLLSCKIHSSPYFSNAHLKTSATAHHSGFHPNAKFDSRPLHLQFATWIPLFICLFIIFAWIFFVIIFLFVAGQHWSLQAYRAYPVIRASPVGHRTPLPTCASCLQASRRPLPAARWIAAWKQK